MLSQSGVHDWDAKVHNSALYTCTAVHICGPEFMTQAVYSLHVPIMPHMIPQQLIVVSNILLATSYGCNSLLLLNPQGSI